MTDLRQECEWLAENLLGWEPQDEVHGIKLYLREYRPTRADAELLTGNGMVEITEALFEKGQGIDIRIDKTIYEYEAWVGPNRRYGRADTLPKAVVLAAYRALKEQA